MIFLRFMGILTPFSGHDSQIPVKINKFDTTKVLETKYCLVLGYVGVMPRKRVENPINLRKIMKLANFHLKMSDHLQDAFFKIS